MAINAFTYASELDCFDRSPVYARNTDLDTVEEPEPPEPPEDGPDQPVFLKRHLIRNGVNFDFAYGTFYPFEGPGNEQFLVNNWDIQYYNNDTGGYYQLFRYSFPGNNQAKYAGLCPKDEEENYYHTEYFDKVAENLKNATFDTDCVNWLKRRVIKPRYHNPLDITKTQFIMGADARHGWNMRYPHGPNPEEGWGIHPAWEQREGLTWSEEKNYIRPFMYTTVFPYIIKCWIPKKVYDGDYYRPHKSWHIDITTNIVMHVEGEMTGAIDTAPPASGMMRFEIMFAPLPKSEIKTHEQLRNLKWVTAHAWNENLGTLRYDGPEITTTKNMSAYMEQMYDRHLLMMITPTWLWDENISEITPRNHSGYFYTPQFPEAEKRGLYYKNGIFRDGVWPGVKYWLIPPGGTHAVQGSPVFEAAQADGWSYITKPFTITDDLVTTTFTHPKLYIHAIFSVRPYTLSA